MQLTKSQTENFLTTQEALEERSIVLLTGGSQGKTRVIHQALEVLGQRDERTGAIATRPRHEENRTVDFYPRIQMPNRSDITSSQVMRQVLQYANVPFKPGAVGVTNAFEGLLKSSCDRGRVVFIVLDNAELLSRRAFTIVKMLNEYRDPAKRRDIGCAMLLACDLNNVKNIPMSLLHRAKEIRMARITNEEIGELINSIKPNAYDLFDERSLASLAKCRTTLLMRRTVERCLDQRKRYRLTSIDFDLVEEQLGLAA